MPRHYRAGLMQHGDGRAAHIQDLRRRYAAIVQDLGGPEELSAIELARVERLAHCEHWISRLEALLRDKAVVVPPEQVIGSYMSLLHASLRLGDGLGVKRRAKRAPSLAEYMQAKSNAAPKAPPRADAEGEIE